MRRPHLFTINRIGPQPVLAVNYGYNTYMENIMFMINFLRAWTADSLIQLGFSIAPPHYLEQMFSEKE